MLTWTWQASGIILKNMESSLGVDAHCDPPWPNTITVMKSLFLRRSTSPTWTFFQRKCCFLVCKKVTTVTNKFRGAWATVLKQKTTVIAYVYHFQLLEAEWHTLTLTGKTDLHFLMSTITKHSISRPVVDAAVTIMPFLCVFIWTRAEQCQRT